MTARAPRGSSFDDKYIIDSSSGCHVWIFAKNQYGYGIAWIDGKNVVAHRYAFLRAGGIIPEGFVLDHLCKVKACVNPAHLEPVSQRVNIVDREPQNLAAQKAAQTHCLRGHEFSSENTYRTSKGTRSCRACRRVNS